MEYTVDLEYENSRIDRLLKKICKNETLSNIFRALKKGDVRVNGAKIKENYRLVLGDVVTIKYLKFQEDVLTGALKESKKVYDDEYDNYYYKSLIIFENEDFFIVNKPPQIPMHKGTGHKFGLSEIYKQIYNNSNVNFANRLDNDTSGLVIGCKNLKFLRYMTEKIRNNEIKKKYVAIVHGDIKDSYIKMENYLKVTEKNVIVSDEELKESKKCISIVRKRNLRQEHLEKLMLLEEFEKMQNERITTLEIELMTGRKHQIRAQLAHRKNPIVGDKKYGKKDVAKRLCLACYKVEFDNFTFVI
ncbi:MAG: RluA family pseudouridine synthase [Leptotrichiaceae bacterium]|nr:RluA family pseudouridine synthase [Leptotrichiaceae bacterium]MBP9539279.1 RluA family pseudouridine synthase [Leptotrichiaceae bacterium]